MNPKQPQYSNNNRHLRVAYVAMRFPLPSETFALNDVRTLSEAGIEISVLPLRRSDSIPVKDLLEQYSIATHQLVEHTKLLKCGWLELLRNPLRWLSTFGRLAAWNLSRPKALLQTVLLYPGAVGAAVWCREYKADIAHLRWGHHPALMGLILKAWNIKTAVSLSLSAYDLELDLPATRRLIPHADAIRTLGVVNVQPIAHRYGLDESKIHVIYNSLPDELFDGSAQPSAMEPPSDESRGDDWEDNGRDSHLIVTAGRLIESKRVDMAIRVFTELAQRNSTMRLEIIGDGPERSALEALATQLGVRERIQFAGMLPYRDVLARMRKAGIFLMLSAKSSERLPNVVKEALAAGCAVISTDSPGIEELIEPGKSGLIVPTDDIAAATAALKVLLDDPDYAASLGENGRQHMSTNFRLSNSAAQYIRLWQSLRPYSLGNTDNR